MPRRLETILVTKLSEVCWNSQGIDCSKDAFFRHLLLSTKERKLKEITLPAFPKN